MPILRISTDHLEIDVIQNESIQDICDRYNTSILFGCFSARCGACRINVVENPGGLSQKTEMETELLELIDSLPNHRLACQCKVLDDVTIEVLTLK